MNLKFVVIFLSSLAVTSALADDQVHPFINSKYSVQAGVFFPSKDVRLRVDGSVATEGREFDFGKATGISEKDEIFEIEFTWRFGKKWSARLQHYAADRSETTVLKEDITWRDQGILAGSSVDAGTNFHLSRLFFGRSLSKRDKTDAGLGLGVHWLEIGAFVNPDIITTFGATNRASVSGPLPNIGGWYYYSPSPKWLIGGRIDWLEANVKEYNGGIINVSAGLNYQLFEHVGIGVNYQMFRLDVEIDDDKWDGSTRLDYDGAFVYVSANW